MTHRLGLPQTPGYVFASVNGKERNRAGTRLVEIDSATGIQPGDPVIVKKGASAFFGTSLAALLSGCGVDTVVVAGATQKYGDVTDSQDILAWLEGVS
jgi:nicotinamidase-related amidase